MNLIEIVKNAPEIVIACSSLILATLAFFLSLWSAYSERSHKRLSTKPLLDFEFHLEIPSEMMKKKPGIYITNYGLGSAIVKEFRIYYADELQNRVSVKWSDAFKQHMSGQESVKLGVYAYEIFSGTAIPINQEIGILVVSSQDNHASEELFSFLRKVRLVIKYTSIYEEKIWTKTFDPDLALGEVS